MPAPQRLCLYCGQPTKRGRRGEHIVPEALGGCLTLNDMPTDRVVCAECNNGVLSRLDRELCSRSYLSLVASQQIDGHVYQAWDVDHADRHQLIEARPEWAEDELMSSLHCFPQIIFQTGGPEVLGDAEEFERFGRDDATRLLFKAVRQAFGRWCKTGKGVIFEQIQSGGISDGYRLAPRVFIRHTLREIASDIHKDKQKIILRYADEEDKRLGLYSLSKLGDTPKLTNWSQKRGSHWPSIGCSFDIGETLRALMKMGLNLIAAYCEKTPVDHQAFASAIRIIRGERPMSLSAVRMSGFVHAEDIQGIKAGDNDHSFLLMHDDGAWHVFSSFFGGRVGAFVRIPGPNHEDWNGAYIVAPIGSKDWTFTPRLVLQIMRVRVAWNGCEAITPSFKLQRSVSSIRAKIHRRRA